MVCKKFSPPLAGGVRGGGEKLAMRFRIEKRLSCRTLPSLTLPAGGREFLSHFYSQFIDQLV
jgi:hypothetical protein